MNIETHLTDLLEFSRIMLKKHNINNIPIISQREGDIPLRKEKGTHCGVSLF